MQMISLLLAGLLSSAALASPRAEFEAWRKKDLEEKKNEPLSLFSLTDYVELRPGESVYLSLGPVKRDPKWLKQRPAGEHAAFSFDGKNLKLESAKESFETPASRQWMAPNGLAILSSSAKRGYVWIYLHAPMRNKFRLALMPWFPFNEKAVVRAKVDRSRKDDKPTVKTTKGDTRDYKVLGVAQFTYGGKPHELQLFTTNPETPLDVFIAFKDATSGRMTYGGGRYVEARLESADSEELTIDFNRAYNPYCAYSRHYNCPLVSGNRIEADLKAGAKLPPSRLDGETN